MTRTKVINQLTLELVSLTGAAEHMTTMRRYIEMALDVGINHFTKDMEEIVVLDQYGHEVNRFKGVTDAADKMCIKQACISAVLSGQQHTAGGYRFIKAEDRKLIPKTDKYGV
jgi:hypothetical protein